MFCMIPTYISLLYLYAVLVHQGCTWYVYLCDAFRGVVWLSGTVNLSPPSNPQQVRELKKTPKKTAEARRRRRPRHRHRHRREQQQQQQQQQEAGEEAGRVGQRTWATACQGIFLSSSSVPTTTCCVRRDLPPSHSPCTHQLFSPDKQHPFNQHVRQIR